MSEGKDEGIPIAAVGVPIAAVVPAVVPAVAHPALFTGRGAAARLVTSLTPFPSATSPPSPRRHPRKLFAAVISGIYASTVRRVSAFVLMQHTFSMPCEIDHSSPHKPSV